MPALRHRELAQRRIVEAELVLVAFAQESERSGWTEIAEWCCPLAVKRALAAVVLGDLRIGVETEHGHGEAGVEGRSGAGERAGWRGAADVHGLAEIEFEAELISRGLRPERVACARHRRGQDQPVDLAFFEAGPVEQRCK